MSYSTYYATVLPLRTEIMNLIRFKQTSASPNAVVWLSIDRLWNDKQDAVFSENCYVI